MSSNERIVAGDRFNGVLMSYTTYYVGTCLVPSTGKFDRKRFTGSRGEALSDWNAWCEEVRDSDLDARRRALGQTPPVQGPDSPKEPAKPRRGRPPKAAHTRADESHDCRKEEPTMSSKAVSRDDPSPSALPKTVYVVQVVGGPAIYFTDDFDVAASVCDGLAAGAKASGFAAAYDVVEVKRWAA